jgi:flavin reductase (DIM6/NTAB) family NADH-FMN oxidoreductase RutF/predicted ester cyclase
MSSLEDRASPAGARSPQQLVEQAWAVVQAHDWEALDRYFHPDYVRHTGTTTLLFSDFRKLLQEEHAAFPDTRFELGDFVPGGDRIAYRWSSSATHLGPYLGVPPTGRPVAVSGISISRVREGKIAEDWTSWNKHELLTTLGIIPLESAGTTSARRSPADAEGLAEALRGVHRAFPTGVTIVSTSLEGTPAGLAVNAFSSIALDPPLVLFCVGKSALTYPGLFAGDAVAINVLAADQRSIAERFARSGGDKFAGLGWRPGENGAPLIDDCAAVLEGVIENRIPIATHSIFITRVERAEAFARAPLLYLGGEYHDASKIGS